MASRTSGSPGVGSSRPAQVRLLYAARGDHPRRLRHSQSLRPPLGTSISGPRAPHAPPPPNAPHSRAGVLKGSDPFAPRLFQPRRRTDLQQAGRSRALSAAQAHRAVPTSRRRRGGGARRGGWGRGAGRAAAAAAHFRRAAFPGRACLAEERPTGRPPWGPAGLACRRRAGVCPSAAPRCSCCSSRPPRGRSRPEWVRTARGAGRGARVLSWGGAGVTATRGRRPAASRAADDRGARRGPARPLCWSRPCGRGARPCEGVRARGPRCGAFPRGRPGPAHCPRSPSPRPSALSKTALGFGFGVGKCNLSCASPAAGRGRCPGARPVGVGRAGAGVADANSCARGGGLGVIRRLRLSRKATASATLKPAAVRACTPPGLGPRGCQLLSDFEKLSSWGA